MSEAPIPKPSSILNRKFLNVPVLYWAAGFVAVLAFMAWRMKPNAPVDDSEFQEDELAPGISGGGSLAGSFPNMPTGTVVVAPEPVEQDNSLDNQSITSNDEWLKRGVALMVERGESAGNAQRALQSYLEGRDMSYADGAMRDAVIAEYGLPPFPPSIGSTSSKPGRNQGPLPRNHRVEGNSDNTVGEIANIYYGRSDSFARSAIMDRTSYKSAWGNTQPTFPIGTQIYVPVLPVPKPKTEPVTKPKPKPKKVDNTWRPLLRRGSTGSHVRYLQKEIGASVDGIFGPKTESAVRAFQRRNRLVVDGVVGPKTWAKIG